jgi:probable F420-dependent oxidoreductase
MGVAVGASGAEPVTVGMTMPVDDELRASELLELAVLAEKEGYAAAFVGEAKGPEAFSLLGAMARATDRIRIGSGIVATLTRSPVLAGMGFATLASLAPGRVVAGVGASSPGVIEGWHGLRYEAPLATMREFVEVLRRVLRGERVDHAGEHFRVSGFTPGMPVDAPPPVWMAAINDRMLRLAGAIADGVILTWCPPDEVPGRLAAVRAGAEAVGRSPEGIEVACSFWAYAGPEVAVATDRLRRAVLAYAMVPTHRRAFVESFPRLEMAAKAWDRGERRAALEHVEDHVVATFCAADATGAAIAGVARTLCAAGVDLPLVLPYGARVGDASSVRGTLQAAAKELALRGSSSS